jgi:hypothetical protein
MPPRASHLPNIYERSVLQKLSSNVEMPTANLSSSATFVKLLAKGWIERGSSAQVYRITPTGSAALRAKLPMNKGIRPAIERS